MINYLLEDCQLGHIIWYYMTIMVFTDLLILNRFDPTVQFCPTASILQVLSCVQTKRTAASGKLDHRAADFPKEGFIAPDSPINGFLLTLVGHQL